MKLVAVFAVVLICSTAQAREINVCQTSTDELVDKAVPEETTLSWGISAY